MSKLQMDVPLHGGVTPQLTVWAQHVARPPTPWRWVIYEEGEAQPVRCSTGCTGPRLRRGRLATPCSSVCPGRPFECQLEANAAALTATILVKAEMKFNRPTIAKEACMGR